MREIRIDPTFESWQSAARALLREGLPPAEVQWIDDLYKHATQAVFSRGPQTAQIALVGEVPGDQEDLRGEPFVGPAGEVLDRALGEVKLRRDEIYVTNAVKHFKFERAGKRRIHKTPAQIEVAACRPWLEAELALVKPRIVVCLGATAARSMLGESFRIMKQHGQWIDSRWSKRTIATIHPSAVLRGDDLQTQERNYAMLVGDLGKSRRSAWRWIGCFTAERRHVILRSASQVETI